MFLCIYLPTREFLFSYFGAVDGRYHGFNGCYRYLNPVDVPCWLVLNPDYHLQFFFITNVFFPFCAASYIAPTATGSRGVPFIARGRHRRTPRRWHRLPVLTDVAATIKIQFSWLGAAVANSTVFLITIVLFQFCFVLFLYILFFSLFDVCVRFFRFVF